MQELAHATSELIIHATQRGDTVRYIHTIPATGRVPRTQPTGTRLARRDVRTRMTIASACSLREAGKIGG
jgi:hypothetical protein